MKLSEINENILCPLWTMVLFSLKKKIVNKMDDENRSKQSDQRQSQSE